MKFTRHFRSIFIFAGKNSYFSKITKLVEPKVCIPLIVPVATFGLGTWQVQRRTWKLNLIKELEEKINFPVTDLIQNLEDISKLEYCRVRAKGVFDHTKEMYIGPRAPINTHDEKDGGMFSMQSQSGYFVITPFKLIDSDISILVNRGWVPKSKIFPKSRQQGQIEEVVELVGTVRSTEKRSAFCPENNPASNIFHFRDIETMAKKCNALPIFLDANSDSSQPGGPLGGQTRVTLRNEHLSYIITWYSLSAITSWMWYKKFIRGLPIL